MTKRQAIQLFEERKVRTVWDDEQEKWYFSIVDVCGVLTDSKDALTARKYWNKLKQRLKEEGFQRTETLKVSTLRHKLQEKEAVWLRQLANNLKANWAVVSLLRIKPATICCPKKMNPNKKTNKDEDVSVDLSLVILS